jgi:hypothetical protein
MAKLNRRVTMSTGSGLTLTLAVLLHQSVKPFSSFFAFRPSGLTS